MMLRLFILITFFIPPAFSASPVWQVTSGQNKIFLGGTVHILRASDYPLPDSFDQAFKQSDIVVFETDITQSQSAEFRYQMLKAVMLPPETRLETLLSPQTLADLEGYLHNNEMTLQQFAGLKPSMISINLTVMELRKLGAGVTGVDAYYYDQAKKQGLTTLALETVQQQIDFLANMGEGQEDLMIRQTLEDIKTMPELFSDMVDSWRTGNTEKLKKLFIDTMQQDFNAIYQRLLVKRNQQWLPKLLEFIKTPETELVLVGSAHLIGPDGLLHALEQAGYRVTQLD